MYISSSETPPTETTTQTTKTPQTTTPISFSDENTTPNPNTMIIEHNHHQQQLHSLPSSHHFHQIPTSSNGPGPHVHVHGPKKRAETWVQDETRSLIMLRREMDSLFNTSKSNKHLWEQISGRMRERGFDRSPTMCTDKWRNLLKEFKKAKQLGGNGSQGQNSNLGLSSVSSNGGSSSSNAKMSYYKEIEEILRERSRNSVTIASANQNHGNHGSVDCGGYNGNSDHKSPNDSGGNGGGGSSAVAAKVDSFLQFSDKGIDDASIPFGPIEAANGRPSLNLERSLDHDGHPLAITAADPVTGDGVSPSFWRETSGNEEPHSFGGRVITVEWGDFTRRVGVEGTAEAIKDVIRSAFGLRTKRAFWLEDENQVVRSLDRDMPLGTYTLHLDEGMTIKLCHYDESDHISYPTQTISHAEEKTFYTEEDFREFMQRRGWSYLRELNGYRNVDNLDDLRPNAVYRGVA